MNKETMTKTEAAMEAIQEYHQAMDEYYDNLNKHNSLILEKVKGMCPKKVFDEIMEYIEEVENMGTLIISDKPKGNFQDEGFDHIHGVYVDQGCQAWAEDAYYGTVSIPIGNDSFLEIPYSC